MYRTTSIPSDYQDHMDQNQEIHQGNEELHHMNIPDELENINLSVTAQTIIKILQQHTCATQHPRI